MIFTTITTAQAMQNMLAFVQSSDSEKIKYVKARYSRLQESDIGELSDVEILAALKPNEERMMLFVNQYERVKDGVTPGLVLDASLLSEWSHFVNSAVVSALETIVNTLGSVETSGSLLIEGVIDRLFNDREYLRARLSRMRSLIGDAQLQSEIIHTDRPTFELVYKPVTAPNSQSDNNFGMAFLEWMGVEPCMLINHRCLENNALYTPGVSGFGNEYCFYIMLHELVHLLLGANDETYSPSPNDDISKVSVYVIDNLKPHEVDNVDNYCALIFIVLSLMHDEGHLDLTLF